MRQILNKTKKHNGIAVTDIAVLGGFFICIMLLAFLFPRTGDDWAWGSAIGLKRLEAHFANYNGRYLGNLLILALTRSGAFAPVFVALVLTAILFFMWRAGSRPTGITLLASAFLLIALSKAMFSQIYVWLSGFSNYAPPVLLILVYFYLMKKYTAGNGIRAGTVTLLLSFLIGFSAQLFMEHNTVYAVLISLLLLLICIVKRTKNRLLPAAFALSFLMGAAVMFANGAYKKIISGQDNYRAVLNKTPNHSGLLHTFLKTFENSLAPELLNSVTLCVALCLLGIILVIVSRKRSNALLNFFMISGFVCIPGYLYIRHIKDISKLFEFTNTLAAAVFFGLLALAAAIYIKDKKMRNQLLLLIFSTVLLTLPLLVVKPVGPRCFFGPYVFLVMAGNEFIGGIAANLQEQRAKPAAVKTLAVLASAASLAGFIVITGFHYGMFSEIHMADTQRIDYIRSEVQKGESRITVPELPNSEYLHCADPVGFWAYRFKLYYGLPQNLEFKLVKYGDWKTDERTNA